MHLYVAGGYARAARDALSLYNERVCSRQRSGDVGGRATAAVVTN